MNMIVKKIKGWQDRRQKRLEQERGELRVERLLTYNHSRSGGLFEEFIRQNIRANIRLLPIDRRETFCASSDVRLSVKDFMDYNVISLDVEKIKLKIGDCRAGGSIFVRSLAALVKLESKVPVWLNTVKIKAGFGIRFILGDNVSVKELCLNSSSEGLWVEAKEEKQLGDDPEIRCAFADVWFNGKIIGDQPSEKKRYEQYLREQKLLDK